MGRLFRLFPHRRAPAPARLRARPVDEEINNRFAGTLAGESIRREASILFRRVGVAGSIQSKYHGDRPAAQPRAAPELPSSALARLKLERSAALVNLFCVFTFCAVLPARSLESFER